MGSMAGKPLIDLGFVCKNGVVSDLEGGVRLSHSDGQDPFEPFGFSFCPNWRESGVQLTEKQAVLLMHDIYYGFNWPMIKVMIKENCFD